MNSLVIRNEQEKDYRAVEEAAREAFWNIYIPGCEEHYLIHILRQSPDFIPGLTFVAEAGGNIAGSIFFVNSYVLGEQGTKHHTITFGPLSVLPELQNQGIGAALIEHAKQAAIAMGHRAILIYGYPDYYKRFGFCHAGDFGISNPDGKYPYAHLALELYPGALGGITGKTYETAAYNVDQSGAQEYDAQFEPKEKLVTPSQKVFEETAVTFL